MLWGIPYLQRRHSINTQIVVLDSSIGSSMMVKEGKTISKVSANSSNGIGSDVITVPPSNWLVPLRMVLYLFQNVLLPGWIISHSSMAGTISALVKGSWYCCVHTSSLTLSSWPCHSWTSCTVLQWPQRKAHWHPEDRSSSLLGCWCSIDSLWRMLMGVNMRVSNPHSLFLSS